MNTATNLVSNDDAYSGQYKPMMMIPVIIFPFVAMLFYLGKGGKGERYLAQDEAANRAGSGAFNAKMPNAKGGSMDGRNVEGPGYGKAAGGQTLSIFSSSHKDSISAGLKPIGVKDSANAPTRSHASSLVASTSTHPAATRSNSAAIAATGGTSRNRVGKGYQYKAPQPGPYYSASASDIQVESQLQAYERTRYAPAPSLSGIQPRSEPNPAPAAPNTPPPTVQLSDQLTASRLDEPVDSDNVFHTAPTGGSRPKAQRTVLSGSNSYGSKKTVAWLIPVVVHEDQAIKEGQQVKLRLLKEITADGVTIPTNTILYAVCQLSDDRLRLTVRSLQLGSQLIPLDLDVYDTDGSPGINVPGLAQSNQMGGQMRSSAIQGVQVPGLGGLANTVLNSARMGASSSVRQSTIRLRAGYNLFLKA